MVVPDDIYKEDVDFSSLAMQYASFAKKLKANGQLDFSDPESVRQLTKALLQRDFDLTIDLPEDRLCPPVPNRFNYIIFIQKLVDSTRPDYRDSTPPTERVLGLDIGTGASAIYPLLACRQRSNWYFLGTEIDPKSRNCAVQNVKSNNLQSRIKIVTPDENDEDDDGGGVGSILPRSQIENFDDYTVKIQMTNPPFYASPDEMLESAKQKARPPNSACTGAPIEMITTGGETTFVATLIRESSQAPFRTKIQWFSSMLGKLSSVSTVIETLKASKCTNYVVSEFLQGQKTRRWCVAWSWCALRPPASLARGITSGALEKKYFPFPSEYEFEIDVGLSNSQLSSISTKTSIRQQEPIIKTLVQLIGTELSNLDLEWNTLKNNNSNDQNTHSGIGRSPHGDVWSRKARRQRQQQQQTNHEANDTAMTDIDSTTTTDGKNHAESEDTDDEQPEYIDDLPLAFKITIQQKHINATPSSVMITIRWLQGHDSVLFESFCGWLKRRVGSSHPQHLHSNVQ